MKYGSKNRPWSKGLTNYGLLVMNYERIITQVTVHKHFHLRYCWASNRTIPGLPVGTGYSLPAATSSTVLVVVNNVTHIRFLIRKCCALMKESRSFRGIEIQCMTGFDQIECLEQIK